MLILNIFAGCAQLVSFFDNKKDYRFDMTPKDMLPTDYSDHLASLGASYLSSEAVEQVRLSSRARSYLKDITDRIVRNNELLLNQALETEINIVKDKSIFFFSLPKGQLFFSQGLVDKYFKSEEIFVACLTHEIIRSHRNIYEKKSVVPVGFVKVEKLLYLTRITPDVKSEINKLSYFAMKRAGFDANAFLNWLQTQNKNTLDFMVQLGETRSISREELAFKNFLVSEEKGFSENVEIDSNSTLGFYTFLNEVKRASP